MLDIFEETGMKNCKPINSHMDSNQKLMRNQGELYIEKVDWKTHISYYNKTSSLSSSGSCESIYAKLPH